MRLFDCHEKTRSLGLGVSEVSQASTNKSTTLTVSEAEPVTTERAIV